MISTSEAAAKAKWATAHPQRWSDELHLHEEEEAHRFYEESTRHAIELTIQAYNKAYVEYLMGYSKPGPRPDCIFWFSIEFTDRIDRIEEFLEQNLPPGQRAVVDNHTCETCGFSPIVIYIY